MGRQLQDSSVGLADTMSTGKDVAELLHTRPLSLISRVGEKGKGSFTTSSDESDPLATKMVRCSADLKTACESTIIKELGEIATGRCSCGGMLQSPPTVLLNFLGKSARTMDRDYLSWSGRSYWRLLKWQALACNNIATMEISLLHALQIDSMHVT